MIIYTLSAETKAAIIVALVNHGADPRMSGALDRVPREETPLALSGIITAWPTDANGMFRISLSDVAGALVWRAYVIAEIAAGRGRMFDIVSYADRVGVETSPAYDYVKAQMKGRGVRPVGENDAGRRFWSDSVLWVFADGDVAEPRKRWASSAWRGRAVAHETLAAAGLAVAGRSTWRPQATLLFATPKLVKPAPALAPADEAALAELAA
jgi:hypothetical protein